MTDPVHIAFVCVQNAGRSQMAAAFAERERDRRGLARAVSVSSGGTDPAERVHDVVVTAMADVGLDIADRTPRAITPAEMEDVDIVITMGCSAADVCPATWRGDTRDWDFDDPHGKALEQVRAIRDEIEVRVEGLFDELVGTVDGS